ncbi:methyltransferase domain-containing protein [Flavobacterium alkalisoli]|uniref:Methyltransferase domain-containing protein n=1 Tax=Flavobacterium alkalisoli TaxID=2602769 RepID=A0A5B9FVG3_9FLAO|nr:class I SAM-dependent methyltransferase [Flavobacterium alkalisoli]QEE50309.1 methyltransferase domain-containing protein [Flavobacterium alkalisoli]
MKLTENQLQQLARQLSHPEGETGLEVAEMMNFTNGNLINKVIDSLQIKEGDAVLEIGPGNGAHVSSITKTPDTLYYGADISETMIHQAQKLNASQVNASFILTNGDTLPFETEFFKKAFTVNTIYFWKDPQAYAAEIARVMQPGGTLSIGFIPKSTMIKIPFAKYGFTMYEAADVEKLLKDTGFKILDTIEDTEQVLSNNVEYIDREITIVTAVLK